MNPPKTPTTTIIQDPKGNKFDVSQVQKGLIETWMREDIVRNINGNQHVRIVRDEDGQISQYIFYKRKWIGLQDRDPLVEKDFKGEAVDKKAFVVEKVTINIDREVSTDIIYIDRWDAKKLADAIDQETSTRGQFVKVPIRAREQIYFEILRAAAQKGQREYKDVSKFDYIRELKLTETNEKFTEKIQAAIDDVISLANDYMDGIDEEDLAVITPHQGMTKISNTQSFSGGSNSQEQLEKGQVGWLNSVKVYRSHRTNGITYVTMRGVACAPLLNQEIVTWPSKSNSLAIALEFATTNAGEDKLYIDFGTVALGDPNIINAKIRPKPDKEKLEVKNDSQNSSNENSQTQMDSFELSKMIAKEIEDKKQIETKAIAEKKESDEKIAFLEQTVKKLQETLENIKTTSTENNENDLETNQDESSDTNT